MNSENRCVTCKFWSEGVTWSSTIDIPNFRTGYCNAIEMLWEHKGPQITISEAMSDTYPAQLITAEQFGCVMHQSKT